MKFRSLDINDFQAHKNLVIEFSPSITTLKGATDVGKSAILRALRWACLNDLTGEGFIKEGAKKAVVAVQVNSPELKWQGWITRTKGAGGNTNIYNLEEEEFKAFGQGVPSDISKILKLNEINFQSQHDAPFWFSETAGEVSRRLNAVIDLSVIDLALSNVASEVRRAQERKSICEERLQELKKQLEQLEAQKSRVKEFDELKAKHEELNQATKNHDRLASLLDAIRERRVSEREEKAKEGEALLRQASELYRLTERTGTLSDILIQLRELGSKAKPPPDFVPVEKLYLEWQRKKERAEKLERVLKQIDSARTVTEAKDRALAKSIEDFSDRTRGQLCPTCGSKIIDLHYE